MLKMGPQVVAGPWKGAAPQAVLYSRIFHKDVNLSCTGQIATMISHQNPCLAIRLFKVNNLSK